MKIKVYIYFGFTLAILFTYVFLYTKYINIEYCPCTTSKFESLPEEIKLANISLKGKEHVPYFGLFFLLESNQNIKKIEDKTFNFLIDWEFFVWGFSHTFTYNFNSYIFNANKPYPVLINEGIIYYPEFFNDISDSNEDRSRLNELSYISCNLTTCIFINYIIDFFIIVFLSLMFVRSIRW